ncbi:DUF599 domain-containing protein [Thalassococcus sp. CAU 1522]|uniref:DUF599 domain-containing protein n=1 Tax=Thalassococcus arenae TaxID=2851652 RepID=A0ABS6N723_9RHOB|nr:DUF599 domain-containing protein [Thalassococcus arenae]MBV2359593.1 DUF599 domain-containing protein [Thalassococcus arenae]
MTWIDRLSLFSPLDYVALALLVCCWLGVSWLIEHPPGARPSTAHLMADYRREWMRHFLTRDPRIFDSQIIGNLRQGTAFFASACMIAIGGGVALLGNAERLAGVAGDLTLDQAPIFVWEVKVIAILLLTTNAFLKFVWAHRLFGYGAVLMAAVPNDPNDPVARARANKAGEINVLAARSYNRGLRSVYFGIAAIAWLAGAWVLVVATLFTLSVVLRREFGSHSRAVLLDDSDRTKL